MRIGIIGGGAIGLLISSYLSEYHDVTIHVKRQSQVDKIHRHGISLLDSNKLIKSTNINVALLNKSLTYDLWIVTVKQYHIQDVLEHIPEQTPVIYVQNGMSHVRLLQKRTNSYIGIVEHGASRKNDNTVKHLGKGKITVVSVTGNDKDAQNFALQLNDEVFPFYKSNHWELLLKEKLTVNAVINPLTALFDVTNEGIVANKYIHQIAKLLHKEVTNTLKLDESYYWEKVMKIAKNTSENSSSMRTDIKHKRRTEIDAITGYILQESHETLPYNQFVYDAILAIEERNKNGGLAEK